MKYKDDLQNKRPLQCGLTLNAKAGTVPGLAQAPQLEIPVTDVACKSEQVCAAQCPRCRSHSELTSSGCHVKQRLCGGQHVYCVTSRPYALGHGGAALSELVEGLWCMHLINF